MHKSLSDFELSSLHLHLMMVHGVGAAEGKGVEGNHFQKLLYSLTIRAGPASHLSVSFQMMIAQHPY